MTKKPSESDSSQAKPETMPVVVDQDDTSGSKSNNKAKSKDARVSRNKHTGIFVVLSLLLLISLSMGVFGIYQYHSLSADMIAQQKSFSQFEQRLDNAHNTLNQQMGVLKQLSSQQQSAAEHTARLESRQQQLSSSLKQLDAQLTGLHAQQGKDPLYWRVAEVEYLLSVANHRLMLARDIDTGVTALADADRRLESIGDPIFIPVREQISKEIKALQAVPRLDQAGMSAQLLALSEQVPLLPLVYKESITEPMLESATDAEAAVRSTQHFLRQLWHDLMNGLFRVRQSEQRVEPLMTPDEKDYLQRNLQLKLEQARLSLNRRDAAEFNAALGDIAAWVKRHFDQDATLVQAFVNTATQLQAEPLKPELPDISGSLRQLRQWMQKSNTPLAQHVMPPKAVARTEVQP